MKLFILDKSIFSFILLLLTIPVKGQDYVPDYSSQKAFACIIIDANTAEPLEKATLRVGNHGWSTDEAGRVETLATIGDTLVFTHIGYSPAILEVKDSLFAQNIVAVSLSPDTILLSEVLVKPRRLTLSQEAKQITALEHKQNSLTKQVFASSTYEALSSSAIMGEWGATDNQRNTIGRYTTQVEYKGMMPPDQMINISSIAIHAIAALINKVADRGRHHYAVKPLTSDELSTLLRQEQQQQEEKEE